MRHHKTPLMCRALGHNWQPMAVGLIRDVNDTITVYACDRCATMPGDDARQTIEKKRIRNGHVITV